MTRATPTSSIWMKAMPTTPWATARMVAVHNAASCSPRCGPATRVAIATAARWPVAPLAMIRPATTRATRNIRMPEPIPASCVSRVLLRPLRCGATWVAAQLRSLLAWAQMPYSGAPISGQSRTLAGGGGISMR
ncbi:hypothetical protein D3C72_1912180 [compost metagenome]